MSRVFRTPSDVLPGLPLFRQMRRQDVPDNERQAFNRKLNELERRIIDDLAGDVHKAEMALMTVVGVAVSAIEYGREEMAHCGVPPSIGAQIDVIANDFDKAMGWLISALRILDPEVLGEVHEQKTRRWWNAPLFGVHFSPDGDTDA